jgi:hypothetical protein
MSNIIDQSDFKNHSPDGPRDPDGCTDKRDGSQRAAGEQKCAMRQGRARCRADRTRGKSKGRRKKARASSFGHTMSLATLAKEYIWLWDVRHGVSTSEIAIRDGVSHRRVQFGVSRACALEKTCPTETAIRPPRLIPLFPIAPYTPQSACGHHGPIEAGSLLCCMVCHCSGIEDHPGLVRNPLTDPAPEPKPAPAPVTKKTARETRKQRRQRMFGSSIATLPQ